MGIRNNKKITITNIINSMISADSRLFDEVENLKAAELFLNTMARDCGLRKHSTRQARAGGLELFLTAPKNL